MLVVPVTVPGPPHAEEEELLEELLEPLELPELPQHMLELELLDDTGAVELELEPELPPDAGLLELPHEMAGLSRRAARRCRPKADASCGSTVINRTKLATAITGTWARRRQVFMSHLAPKRFDPTNRLPAP
jgi:hypothetical protein